MTFTTIVLIVALALFVAVLAGFLIGRLEAADHFSPTKQAERSAAKALRDAQL